MCKIKHEGVSDDTCWNCGKNLTGFAAELCGVCKLHDNGYHPAEISVITGIRMYIVLRTLREKYDVIPHW